MGENEAARDKAPASCQLVSFEHAVIRSREAGGPLLVVSGTAPATNMEVFLSHRVYGETPDWWGIEVVGALPGGVCLTETRHFEVAMPLEQLTGRKGIEVIGAGVKLRLMVEAADAPN